MKKLQLYSLIISVVLLPVSQSAIGQDKCIAGDCENGYGELQCDCGYLYKGEFKSGEKTFGTLFKEELHYTGEFNHDMPWGKGAIYFADSSSYRGAFSGASPHGYGRYYTASGKLYKGMMQNGNYEGFGIQFPDSGDLSFYYAGEFQSDIKTGYGVQKSGDTVRFGLFKKDNFKHGIILVRPSNNEIAWIRSGKGSDQNDYRYTAEDDFIWVRFTKLGAEFFIQPGEFVEIKTPEGKIHRVFIDRESPPLTDSDS